MIRRASGILAAACLAAGLAAAVLNFSGRLSEPGFKTAFGLASVGWFAFATARLAGRRAKEKP